MHVVPSSLDVMDVGVIGIACACYQVCERNLVIHHAFCYFPNIAITALIEPRCVFHTRLLSWLVAHLTDSDISVTMFVPQCHRYAASPGYCVLLLRSTNERAQACASNQYYKHRRRPCQLRVLEPRFRLHCQTCVLFWSYTNRHAWIQHHSVLLSMCSLFSQLRSPGASCSIAVDSARPDVPRQ